MYVQFELLDSPWNRVVHEEGLYRRSFRDLVDEVWKHGNSSVPLPSNLITMFQLSMCVAYSFLDWKCLLSCVCLDQDLSFQSNTIAHCFLLLHVFSCQPLLHA